MRSRLALGTLLVVLAAEIAGLMQAASDPCNIRLLDYWPLSTVAVLGLAAFAVWLAIGKRRIALVLLALVTVADIVHARYRSTLGSLVLGGVEGLVAKAHGSRSDSRALQCLRVVGDATQYGPDQARTFILRQYDEREQARIFRLLARAVPERAGQFAVEPFSLSPQPTSSRH